MGEWVEVIVRHCAKYYYLLSGVILNKSNPIKQSKPGVAGEKEAGSNLIGVERRHDHLKWFNALNGKSVAGESKIIDAPQDGLIKTGRQVYTHTHRNAKKEEQMLDCFEYHQLYSFPPSPPTPSLSLDPNQTFWPIQNNFKMPSRKRTRTYSRNTLINNFWQGMTTQWWRNKRRREVLIGILRLRFRFKGVLALRLNWFEWEWIVIGNCRYGNIDLQINSP